MNLRLFLYAGYLNLGNLTLKPFPLFLKEVPAKNYLKIIVRNFVDTNAVLE
jgi:hypothetical protein